MEAMEKVHRKRQQSIADDSDATLSFTIPDDIEFPQEIYRSLMDHNISGMCKTLAASLRPRTIMIVMLLTASSYYRDSTQLQKVFPAWLPQYRGRNRNIKSRWDKELGLV